ncbi:MAG: GlsB/YeaQ/YmgE family stress response membrane protein [Anaerolineae bacterium]
MDLIQSNLGCVSWVFFGALVGWLASILTGRNNRQGCLMNIIVGVIGAFIGGAIFGLLNDGTLTVGWNLTALIYSIIGAAIFLLVLGMFSRRRR